MLSGSISLAGCRDSGHGFSQVQGLDSWCEGGTGTHLKGNREELAALFTPFPRLASWRQVLELLGQG